MKLSFSTLGCPDWPLDKIINRAREYGYDGVGIRGIMGQMNLLKVPEFAPDRREETVRKFSDAGLKIVMLLTSAKFSSADAEERRRNVQDAKDNIDLARSMGVGLTRIYGGRHPEGVAADQVHDWVVAAFKEVGEYGGKRGVISTIETHDDYTDTYLVRDIVERTDNEYIRVLWDVHHPYRTCGQSMQECWDNVGRYTVHTHFKDSYETGEVEEGFKYCLLGEGDVPNLDALRILRAGGYDGYLSLEWEKAWKPYLPAAEVGFPQFVEKMKQYTAELG